MVRNQGFGERTTSGGFTSPSNSKVGTSKGPVDPYVSLKGQQSTVNRAFKKDQRKKPPSYYEMRFWIVKEVVDNVNNMLEEYKKTCAKSTYSLMTNGCIYGKGRNLINFVANNIFSTVFIKSCDINVGKKTFDNLAKLFIKVIKEVRIQNAVQIITDSVDNYKVVCLKLKEIEGKIHVYEKRIDKAKMITFMYEHACVLSLMRKIT
ncbi:hypothetical protein EJ110_NYTH26930 [Nymphaea thermarum]|nr:hypothetical protein EJ110_NYTH26930 [Nymphaea thermarum]